MRLDDASMEALTRSFLLGTARHPAPALTSQDGAPAPSELTGLAYLGQRMRYRRRAAPAEAAPTPLIDDPRAIMPDAARRPLRRLVGKDGSASDIAALALADACERRRLRLHPFDLPRLDAFVKAHADKLGASASAWAARRDTTGKPGHYFDAEAIDETNWTSAGPAARARFIAALRRHDPDRARTLVEASFATEPAPVRAQLLGALAHRLSAADAPFLQSLAKDRAPTVREIAERLLTRLPGTEGAQTRLRDLVARIKVSTSGLLRRHKMLALELPANVKDVPYGTSAAGTSRRWAVDTYAGLALDAMAAACGLTIAEMIAAAGKDASLLALFARQASIEGRPDVLTTIVNDHAPDAWVDAIGTDGADTDVFDDAWCAAALAPARWKSMPYPADLDRLCRALRRPLPQPQAQVLLASPIVSAMVRDSSSVGASLLLAIAVLTPASLRSTLRRALDQAAPEASARALTLLDCLTLLDPPTP